MNYKKYRDRRGFSQFGNWRDQGMWGQAAKNTYNAANKAKNFNIPISSDIPLVAEGLITYYGDREAARAIKLAEALVWDVYRLGVLPYPVGKKLADNEDLAPLFSLDLREILIGYGGFGILYTDREILPEELIGGAIKVDYDLFLTPKRVGMPVRDYLIWLKGDERVTGAVLAEWSGIRVGRQNYVYNRIVETFRNELELCHQQAERFSQPIITRATKIDLNL